MKKMSMLLVVFLGIMALSFVSCDLLGGGGGDDDGGGGGGTTFTIEDADLFMVMMMAGEMTEHIPGMFEEMTADVVEGVLTLTNKDVSESQDGSVLINGTISEATNGIDFDITVAIDEGDAVVNQAFAGTMSATESGTGADIVETITASFTTFDDGFSELTITSVQMVFTEGPGPEDWELVSLTVNGVNLKAQADALFVKLDDFQFVTEAAFNGGMMVPMFYEIGTTSADSAVSYNAGTSTVTFTSYEYTMDMDVITLTGTITLGTNDAFTFDLDLIIPGEPGTNTTVSMVGVVTMTEDSVANTMTVVFNCSEISGSELSGTHTCAYEFTVDTVNEELTDLAVASVDGTDIADIVMYFMSRGDDHQDGGGEPTP